MKLRFRTWMYSHLATILGPILGYLCTGTVCGQLVWGPGGSGGSGNWDTTTLNWWNGSADVAWTNGSAARFAGMGGNVAIQGSLGVSPTAIIFDAPGYTIDGGPLRVSGSSLTITANQDATIVSALNGNFAGAALVKNGNATLTTTSASNTFDRVQINAGEFVLAGRANLPFSDVVIADVPGAVLTLAPTVFGTVNIDSLSGGGLSGGIVRPNDQARTVTLQISESGIFRGALTDNGSGKLAVEIQAFSETVTLAGVNSYRGATSVSFGTLVLAENGSVLNSGVRVFTGAVLRLDNSVIPSTNRVSDSDEVVVESGRIELIGHTTIPVEEQLGVLKFTGSVSLHAQRPGTAATLLTFAGGMRQNHGTLNITGNGRTKWDGLHNSDSGIVGAYATVDSDWAAVGADGRVEPLANYAADINSASATDHVKLTGNGTRTATGSRTIYTLNFQNTADGTSTLELGSSSLTLSEGGILSTGTPTSAVAIQGGAIRAGGSELIVTNRNDLRIDSVIDETVAGTELTKTGAGILRLTGTNTYSGATVINEGTVVVGSDANLGLGATIEFNGGTLKAAESFTSGKSLTQSTTRVATIDTAGFNVAFSGTNSALSKLGSGILTLTNTSPGSIFTQQGTVVLTSPTSGDVSLSGGTLVASGALSAVRQFRASTIDIGGANAATLTTGSFSAPSIGEILTVRFGLGASAQDLWAITDFASFDSTGKRCLFEFQNLGNLVTGTSYPLITLPPGSVVNASQFGFAPTSLAAGWSGSFAVVSNTVRINLVSIPEPMTGPLGIIGGALIVIRVRLRSRLSVS